MISSLFSFQGTIGRLAFISRSVLFVCVSLIGGVLFYGVQHFNNGPGAAMASAFPFLAVAVVSFLSLTVRRLRDMGWPIFAGLFALVVVTVVGGGLLRLLPPMWSGFAPLGLLAAPLAIVVLAPGLGVLALWPAYKSGNSLSREIEALRAAAEAEGRLTPPTGTFGRRPD